MSAGLKCLKNKLVIFRDSIRKWSPKLVCDFALTNEIYCKFYASTDSHSSAARKRIKGDLPCKD